MRTAGASSCAGEIAEVTDQAGARPAARAAAASVGARSQESLCPDPARAADGSKDRRARDEPEVQAWELRSPGRRSAARDYARFAERLERCLSDLGQLLGRPGFGAGPVTIGAELELFLVDDAPRPLPLNQAVRALAADARIAVELDRFDLELNCSPALLGGCPFTALAGELGALLDRVGAAARVHRGRIALIGVLPTLSQAHLGASAVTGGARYRALDCGLRRLRRGPLQIKIAGAEPLELTSEDISLEGANCSFQVHMRVGPGDFTRMYNAVQLATAPVLAAAGNSPTFLGHRLWEETRVALFKQSVEDRDRCGPRRRPPRSTFGTGWLRDGALELFTESVRLHEPLLPFVSDPQADGPPPGTQQDPPRRPAPAGRAQAAPGHGLALEPGHLRPRRRRSSADRDAGSARGADRDRHAGQRRVPDRAHLVARGAGPAVDLWAAVRARRSRVLPRGPARPGRRAELAVWFASRQDGDRCRPGARTPAGRTPRPGRRRGGRRGRRTACSA